MQPPFCESPDWTVCMHSCLWFLRVPPCEGGMPQEFWASWNLFSWFVKRTVWGGHSLRQQKFCWAHPGGWGWGTPLSETKLQLFQMEFLRLWCLGAGSKFGGEVMDPFPWSAFLCWRRAVWTKATKKRLEQITFHPFFLREVAACFFSTTCAWKFRDESSSYRIQFAAWLGWQVHVRGSKVNFFHLPDVAQAARINFPCGDTSSHIHEVSSLLRQAWNLVSRVHHEATLQRGSNEYLKKYWQRNRKVIWKGGWFIFWSTQGKFNQGYIEKQVGDGRRKYYQLSCVWPTACCKCSVKIGLESSLLFHPP